MADALRNQPVRASVGTDQKRKAARIPVRDLRRLTAAAALLALASCAHRPPRVPYDRAVGLETFDAAWRIVHETYFDTTFGGGDWVALRDSLRPRAADARSRDELVAAARALDRVLLWGRHVVPLFHREVDNVARWKAIQRPDISPLYGPDITTWWHLPD